MVGTKFQKYFVSVEKDDIVTTYTQWHLVKVFDTLDDCLGEVKHLLENHHEYGWYALDYDRWNSKY